VVAAPIEQAIVVGARGPLCPFRIHAHQSRGMSATVPLALPLEGPLTLTMNVCMASCKVTCFLPADHSRCPAASLSLAKLSARVQELVSRGLPVHHAAEMPLGVDSARHGDTCGLDLYRPGIGCTRWYGA